MANKGTTKLNLNVEEIENKRFNNVPRGYDALEVDKFLDIVIKDYLLLEERNLVDGRELDLAEAQIEELRKKIDNLLIENQKLQAKIPNLGNASVNEDNIGHLKRIDALEKFIYKLGYNPKTIK